MSPDVRTAPFSCIVFLDEDRSTVVVLSPPTLRVELRLIPLRVPLFLLLFFNASEECQCGPPDPFGPRKWAVLFSCVTPPAPPPPVFFSFLFTQGYLAILVARNSGNVKPFFVPCVSPSLSLFSRCRPHRWDGYPPPPPLILLFGRISHFFFFLVPPLLAPLSRFTR